MASNLSEKYTIQQRRKLSNPNNNNKCTKCCSDYGKTVASSVFHRKPFNTDMNTVLQTSLHRCLTTLDLISYGLAAMLGGSIYVLTGAVMNKRTGGAVFVAYILAGFVALLNALVYSELACRIPKAGSSYSYAYIILGELLAFLTGWSILLEYILSASTVARGWSSMLDGLCDGRISQWIIENIGRLSPPGGILAEYPDFIGVILIVTTAAISCCGVRGGARVTGFFIFINVIVLIITAIYMFVYANVENLRPIPPVNVTLPVAISPDPLFLPFGIPGLIGGTAICFNAFIGFDAISTCAEEAKTPNKSLPRANVIAVFIVTIVTSMASLALVLYYPWYLVSTEAPFLFALHSNIVNGGPSAARTGMFYFVGCGCLLGLISSLLSNLVAGPRISYAMAQDHLLPHACSHVCKPFKTPVIATTFITILTSLLDLLFSVESLADFLSLGTLIAYSIASIGLIALRYRPPPDLVEDLDQDKTDKLQSDIGNTSSSETLVDKIQPRPGYVKPRWAEQLPKFCVRNLNRGKPGDGVSMILSIYVLFTALLILILRIGAMQGLWPVWRIVLTTICLVGMVLCISLIGAYEQFKSPYPYLFRLPLVPFFPCATLTVNMFLISELSWITWARFGIWLVLGLIIYFTFGICNRMDCCSNSSTTEPEDSIDREK